MIADTINSIKQHIEDAYGIVEEKGGTIPQAKNLQNIADSISSISGGGGGRLPSEYQEVEYIESTGTQYINTLFKPTSETKVEFYYSELKDSCVLYGSYNNNWTTRSYGLFINYPTKSNDYYLHYNSNVRALTPSYITTVVVQNKNSLQIIGKTYTAAKSTFETNQNMGIFAGIGYSDAESLKAKMKLHFFKIYDNDVIVRYFVPCYRKADGEVGLFDTVNKVFYTNQGTGSFTKGNDI